MPRLSRVLAALSVSALVLIGSQSASAAPPCVVTYQPNTWATVIWTCGGSQQITSSWNHDCAPTMPCSAGMEPVDESIVDLSILAAPAVVTMGPMIGVSRVDATPAKGVS